MEVKVTTENFESLKSGSLPLVVDFWAPWCGPCRMVGPVVEALAKDYDGKVVIGKCNVDDEEELAAQFGIMSIPSILFFKDGAVVDKHVGAATRAMLEEKVKALL